jgi:cholesterol transport system auxiliary component
VTIAPRLLLAACAIALLAPACGVLPKREPTRVFTPAHSATPVDGPQVAWSLLVAKPVASQMLDSERISVRPGPGNVQVYKGASWSDPLPELVQAALLRAFEDSQKILTVARPGGGVRGRFQLVTELRSFESAYVSAGRPEATLELQAKLVDSRDGAVVAARAFSDHEPAATEDVGDVIAAFSRALDRTSAQVAGWTLVEGQKHASTHPDPVDGR